MKPSVESETMRETITSPSESTPGTVQQPLAVDVQHVSLSHRGRQMLDNLSLHIPFGVTAGLVGPNGAGKTTTFRLLGGLIGSFSGSVQVLGNAIPQHADTVRRQLGVVTEPDGIYEDMRVRDVLAHVARIYRPQDTEWQQNRVETVLRALDVWNRRDDWCGTLSTGLRRRVAIARAILNAPRLLLLDEVTNGLDIVSRNAFYEWLAQHQLCAPTNTIMLASHNTAEIARLCNFFIVLREGQQLFCGPREELLSPQANAEEVERVFLALLRS